MLKGELDVALFAKPTAFDERLHTIPLFSERMMAGMPPTHPMAMRNAITFEQLLDGNYLSRSNCEYGEHLRQLAEQRGLTIRCPYRSDRDDWIQAMVSAGLGVTTVFENAVTASGLVTRPLIDPEIVRTVHLVTVRGRPHAPTVGAFVHAAKQYWRSVV